MEGSLLALLETEYNTPMKTIVKQIIGLPIVAVGVTGSGLVLAIGTILTFIVLIAMTVLLIPLLTLAFVGAVISDE